MNFAILIAMFAIILYISWRFRHLQFGVAAVIALVHDVLVTVGFFALTGREISLPIIAALLTIVGYSLNDTIVVFDRIREDLKLMRRASFRDIINTSVNQTLSRTLLTSLTTIIGFGSFIPSIMRAMRSTGIVLSLAMALAFIYSLTFHPALLSIVFEKLGRKKDKIET